MEFSTFPFDAHICNFKVHSLEDPNATLQFRYDSNEVILALFFQVTFLCPMEFLMLPFNAKCIGHKCYAAVQL